MCWISDNKPKLEIATKDIPVFKILIKNNNYLTSYFFYDFKYALNIAYSENIGNINKVINDDVQEEFDSNPSYEYMIFEGFHSYSYDCKIEKAYCDTVIWFNDLPIGYYNTYIIVKANCIIPKNSKYYLNNRGEYVSNCIKVIDIEEIKFEKD